MSVIAQMNAAAFRWTCFNSSVLILLATDIQVVDLPRSLILSQREIQSCLSTTMSTGARWTIVKSKTTCKSLFAPSFSSFMQIGLARLSLISPARVISFSTRVLIEFELHAWSDEETDGDNGSIIEGCTELYNMHAMESFVKQNRVYGERCALDIKYLVLINALEACIEVKILSLGATPGGIDLKLCAKSSGFKEVIRLFQGAAPDPGETSSFKEQWKQHTSPSLEHTLKITTIRQQNATTKQQAFLHHNSHCTATPPLVATLHLPSRGGILEDERATQQNGD
ncbi:hypothetical protein EJB05_00895, partial [Eragrostis curvula]